MYRVILVPLEEGSGDEAFVMPHASAIAERFGSELLLLTTVPERRAMEGETHSPAIPEDSRAAVESERRTEIREADDFLEDREHPARPETRIRREVRPGSLDEAIQRAVEEDGVSLIVMAGARRHSLLDRLKPGDPEKVLASTNVPVLLMANPGN